MLQLRAGLTPTDLTAIADLEARTVAVDGGRLKLEWGELNRRAGERVTDLLWWNGPESDKRCLIAFLGFYAFGAAVELAGMVDPAFRRGGIGSALLDAALPLLRALPEGGAAPVLLVCPRTTHAGAAFAAARQAPLHHSEYALVLSGEPAGGPADPDTVLSAAAPDDEPAIRRLPRSGFAQTPGAGPILTAGDAAQHLVVRRDDVVIGYLRLTLARGVGGIYGFVIAPGLRGRGIGRDVLRRACRLLLDQGATSVGLEVAVDNDHALGLYTSTGFTPISTEDYFILPR